MNCQTQEKIEVNGKEFILLGTAHVSEASIKEVEQVIEEQAPDVIAVELDETRYESIVDPESWKDMDIVKVLHEKQGFLLLSNVVLSNYQKKMGSKSSVKPGEEMADALRIAKEKGIEHVLADRSLSVTMRRAWAKTPAAERLRLLSFLCTSAFSDEVMSNEEIENLKQENEMDKMFSEISSVLPVTKKIFIDERDRYIASKIWECKGKKILAVIGVGHMHGVKSYLEKIAEDEISSDVSDIEEVPAKSKKAKILSWTIPALIVALIAAGFVIGGKEKGAELLSKWVLWNGILAGIGAIIGGAHIITVLVSILGAPLTSLCPFIGIGFVAGAVQSFVKKPTVKDIENLQNDSSSIRGFYRNRVLRILLIFFLSSIGSSIGTFAGGASFVSIFSRIFKGQ
ncbi:MAG: TraB/GumN family protein [Treponema sp.]|nr:TraB/GumN family protein [Spirochaetia bacterium]MDD7460360.1 TraB/GumN family protein [Spirochaetales bacterium]MDY5811203.1 TraB/GumN family protein [Treponema sp.]